MGLGMLHWWRSYCCGTVSCRVLAKNRDGQHRYSETNVPLRPARPTIQRVPPDQLTRGLRSSRLPQLQEHTNYQGASAFSACTSWANTRQHRFICSCVWCRGTKSKSSIVHGVQHDRRAASPEGGLAWIVRFGSGIGPLVGRVGSKSASSLYRGGRSVLVLCFSRITFRLISLSRTVPVWGFVRSGHRFVRCGQWSDHGNASRRRTKSAANDHRNLRAAQRLYGTASLYQGQFRLAPGLAVGSPRLSVFWVLY